MKLHINKIFLLLFALMCCNISFAQTDSLRYNIEENSDSPLFLDTPSNITTEVEYDPINNEYILIKKVGDIILERTALTFEEYQNYDLDKMINNYWKVVLLPQKFLRLLTMECLEVLFRNSK